MYNPGYTSLPRAADVNPVSQRGIEEEMACEWREYRQLEERSAAIKNWLRGEAPQCVAEQRHLEEGSQERVYWHYGYLAAIQDVMRLLGRELPNRRCRSVGTASSHSSVSLDALSSPGA